MHTNRLQSIPVLIPEYHAIVSERPSVYLNKVDQVNEARRKVETTDHSDLELRKVLTLRRGLIFARLASIDVSLGFEPNFNRLRGSVIGVL